MSELHEECGIVAVYHLSTGEQSPLCPPQGRNEVSRLVPRMLLDIQNRGQLSAGLTAYNPSSSQLLKTYKDSGTVSEVFNTNHRERFREIMDSHVGVAAIGQVRYSSVGRDDWTYAHPFERAHTKRNKWFSYAFNAQIANYDALKKALFAEDPNAWFARESDSEIFTYYLSKALKNGERDLLKVWKEVTERLDGGYALAYLNALGEMFVARDPLGIKPLCYAFDGSLFAASSESVALFNLGFDSDQIKDVPPGSMIIVSPEKGVECKEFNSSSMRAHCFFEWAYFANVASVIDGKSVYVARKRLGEELAASEFIKFDKEDSIVVPVPDTSKAAAAGMAGALGLPWLEGLIRNRYSGRTFIEGGESRWRKAELKYTPLPEVLEGKRVFLVDDSIVRSTSMRVLIDRIRRLGRPKEIHVRIACPPVMAPCFYGVDMSTYSELFATRFMLKHYGADSINSGLDLTTKWVLTREIEQEMAEELGCDSLHYLSCAATARAIGFPSMNLCMSCVNHEYPTEWGCKHCMNAFDNFLKGVDANKNLEGREAQKG